MCQDNKNRSESHKALQSDWCILQSTVAEVMLSNENQNRSVTMMRLETEATSFFQIKSRLQLSSKTLLTHSLVSSCPCGTKLFMCPHNEICVISTYKFVSN